MTKIDNSAIENGKPRNAPAPVIRKLVVAEEDSKTRLLKRQVPAWVISGLIHVVLIAAFIIFDRVWNKDQPLKAKEPPTATKIDEKPEKEIDLTNPDSGLDSDLAAAVDVVRESEFNVDTQVVTPDSVGLPDQERDNASQTSVQGPMTNAIGAVGDLADTAGIGQVGVGGGGGLLAMPGLNGRSGATKEKLLKAGGGNDETEAAVGRALLWLSKQQNKDSGYWEYDGTHKNDRIAATGMCLLPFLAAGETHKTGKKYKDHVAKGLNYLKAQLKPNGQFAGTMYTQAIATIALCEAAGMTRDDGLKNEAKKAIDFIVQAQDKDGSWGYTANTPGDTSIVGWQIQALKSARMSGILVPNTAFDQANKFLEDVETANSTMTTYGYRGKGGTNGLTAVGLLCRQYTGWNPRNPKLAIGVKYLWEKFPPKDEVFDMYYYYYATQVMHFFDGPAWHRDWNPAMQKILLGKQITERTPGAKAVDIGSWPKEIGHIGSSCGKLGTTALCCLTLEVYYRHLPLYKRDAGGLAALEK